MLFKIFLFEIHLLSSMTLTESKQGARIKQLLTLKFVKNQEKWLENINSVARVPLLWRRYLWWRCVQCRHQNSVYAMTTLLTTQSTLLCGMLASNVALQIF